MNCCVTDLAPLLTPLGNANPNRNPMCTNRDIIHAPGVPGSEVGCNLKRKRSGASHNPVGYCTPHRGPIRTRPNNDHVPRWNVIWFVNGLASVAIPLGIASPNRASFCTHIDIIHAPGLPGPQMEYHLARNLSGVSRRPLGIAHLNRYSIRTHPDNIHGPRWKSFGA